MEAIKFFSKARENALPPKLRSTASRCSEAARGLGFEARTLAYRDSDPRRYLYKDDVEIFECYSWEELLEKLFTLGARIPPERWASRINDVAT